MPLEVRIITEKALLKALIALAATIVAGLAVAPAQAARVYVVNSWSASVSVIDSNSDELVATVPVGLHPVDIAITPDGSRAYVVNGFFGDVSVIDTATNQVVGQPIPVGDDPTAIAISPDGAHAYVTRTPGNYLVTIDTTSNSVVGPSLDAGAYPVDLAVTPDGSRAYVVGAASTELAVVDLATGKSDGTVALGSAVNAIAITPDGSRAYLSDGPGGTSIAVDLSSDTVIGEPLEVGPSPSEVAITPDGARAYMPRRDGTQLASVVGAAGNTLVGAALEIGLAPAGIAITPNGTAAYVADDQVDGLVRRIDTASNLVAGAPIAVGRNPGQIAIAPDQGPVAALAAVAVSPVGVRPTLLDASGSYDPDGTIERYDWDFGDGSKKRDGGAVIAHQYWKAGDHTVRLTVTDDQGVSTQHSFTGQTLSQNGGPQAVASLDLEVPGIVLELDAARAQRFVKRRSLAVSVECPDIPCDVAVSGKARKTAFRRPAQRHLAAGHHGVFRLKLSRRQASGLRRGLRRSNKLSAKIAVRASTSEGDVVKRELTIRNRR